MRLFKLFLFGIILVALWSCSDLGEPVADCPEGQEKDCAGECGGTAVEDCTGECGGTFQDCVNYALDIQPIFDVKCTYCHGGNHYTGLDLTSYASVMEGSNNGPVIIAGDADNSLLWQYINSNYMPMGGGSLTSDQKTTIAQWINDGAENDL